MVLVIMSVVYTQLKVIVLLFCFIKYTVNPVLIRHLWDKEKLTLQDR